MCQIQILNSIKVYCQSLISMTYIQWKIFPTQNTPITHFMYQLVRPGRNFEHICPHTYTHTVSKIHTYSTQNALAISKHCRAHKSRLSATCDWQRGETPDQAYVPQICFICLFHSEAVQMYEKQQDELFKYDNAVPDNNRQRLIRGEKIKHLCIYTLMLKGTLNSWYSLKTKWLSLQ